MPVDVSSEVTTSLTYTTFADSEQLVAAQRPASPGAAHNTDEMMQNSLAALRCTRLLDGDFRSFTMTDSEFYPLLFSMFPSPFLLM